MRFIVAVYTFSVTKCNQNMYALDLKLIKTNCN